MVFDAWNIVRHQIRRAIVPGVECGLLMEASELSLGDDGLPVTPGPYATPDIDRTNAGLTVCEVHRTTRDLRSQNAVLMLIIYVDI